MALCDGANGSVDGTRGSALGDLRNVYAAGYRAGAEIREVVVKWNLMW